MTDEIHKLTPGQYELQFKKHNQLMLDTGSGRDLSMLQFHIAVQLVEQGLWDQKKDNFIVILP